MTKNDLTVSEIERQNILNNAYALEEIEKGIGIKGIPFEGKTVLLKEQVASFFEVTTKTIENLLSNHEGELQKNGYRVLKGQKLKDFKTVVWEEFGNEIDFGSKTTQLGIIESIVINMRLIMKQLNEN